MNSTKLQTLDKNSIHVLEDIFSTSSSLRGGVDAVVYRAQHEEKLALLDDLERKGYLRKDYNQKYWVTLCGLSILGDSSKDLLGRCEILFSFLRAHYKSKPKENIKVGDLAFAVKLTREHVSECLGYMIEASCWGAYSNDFSSADAFLQSSEWILKYKTFREVVEELKRQRDERESQAARPLHFPSQAIYGIPSVRNGVDGSVWSWVGAKVLDNLFTLIMTIIGGLVVAYVVWRMGWLS